MSDPKNYPPREEEPTFFECCFCGQYHSVDMPVNIDCRDDTNRFTFDELDAYYGPGCKRLKSSLSYSIKQ